MPLKARPVNPVRLCSIEGCDRKHLARGLCKLHWVKARREASSSSVVHVHLQSIAWLHSAFAPKVKRVHCRVTVGVMVECPWCSCVMAATSPTFRLCAGCGTSLELNADEVDALVVAARDSR